MSMSVRARACLSAVLLASAAWPAEGGQIRVRAREHFESGDIDTGDGAGQIDHTGLLSAFTIGWEEPWRYLVGLAVQRGSFESIGGSRSLKATALGLEGKWYPLPSQTGIHSYLRGGVLAQAWDPAGAAKDFWNYGLTGGLGLELPVWKLGLASEAGGRVMWGSRGRVTHMLYVGLGLHFYVFPGDTRPER